MFRSFQPNRNGEAWVQPIMFAAYDDVPSLPWNLKDIAGAFPHVAPMPLKSLPPSIRTSGTLHHVM